MTLFRMIDFPSELNKEQLDVVLHGDGPCLVLAGAGSGKTRTITYRVAYLLEQGVAPDEILLVTFTNKAAKEMLSRVSTITTGNTHLPWSGTFHHIAYRILKQYAPLLGYKNNFTVIDSEDSKDLLKICLKVEGVDRKEKRFPSAQVIQSIISYARNAETTVRDVIDLQHPNFLPVTDTIERIADDYRKRKLESNVMDFDDLLVNLYLLFAKESRVRETFATQFRYVLVDEYQDTNTIQASIVSQFASHHKNVLVVGDDAQSIYSFRAANIRHILEFEKEYPGAQIFRLEMNYRSTPEILDLANEVISNNRHQYEKELKSVRESFTRPEVHTFTDPSEEAEFIAGRISELREEGVPLSQMAVLFRAAFHSQALEMELVRRDIPYEFRGGLRFFERAHVKDVLAYLRILNNLADTIAWNRVLTMQVGIGPAGAEEIIARVQTIENVDDLSHLGSLLSSRGQAGWTDFLGIWEGLCAVENKKPSELIRAIIDSKYRVYLENEYTDYRERVADLEQMALFSQRENDLGKFLAEATLQESYTGREKSGVSDDGKLVLSTIHQAKGLEWEAVFVLNVAQGQFPSDRSRGPVELEEERRLFYVAVTRAKRHLYLTYPLSGSFGSFLQSPSIFIEEVSSDVLERDGIGKSSYFDLDDASAEITYEPEDQPVRRPGSFLKGLDEL